MAALRLVCFLNVASKSQSVGARCKPHISVVASVKKASRAAGSPAQRQQCMLRDVLPRCFSQQLPEPARFCVLSTAEGEVTHYTSLSIIVEKEDYVMAQMAANELSMLVDHIEDQ
eukprot:1172649-Prorocentrum_minimum.AAC.1